MSAWKYLSVLATVLSLSANAEQDAVNPEWDTVTRAVWLTFKDRPDMIDRCALKITHGSSFNPETDWPAYCNDFKETEVVRQRTQELGRDISSVKDKKVKAKLASGMIWMGASAKQAELSWGRPKEVHRTITANKTREQWVYGGTNYLYIENGRVVAIQN